MFLIFFLFAMFALRNRSAVCMMAWWRGLFVLSNWCIQRPATKQQLTKRRICSLFLHWISFLCPLRFVPFVFIGRVLVLFSDKAFFIPLHCFLPNVLLSQQLIMVNKSICMIEDDTILNSIFLQSLGSHTCLIEYKSERRRWLCMSSDDQKFLQTFSSPNLLTGWLNKMSIIPK